MSTYDDYYYYMQAYQQQQNSYVHTHVNMIAWTGRGLLDKAMNRNDAQAVKAQIKEGNEPFFGTDSWGQSYNRIMDVNNKIYKSDFLDPYDTYGEFVLSPYKFLSRHLSPTSADKMSSTIVDGYKEAGIPLSRLSKIGANPEAWQKAFASGRHYGDENVADAPLVKDFLKQVKPLKETDDLCDFKPTISHLLQKEMPGESWIYASKLPVCKHDSSAFDMLRICSSHVGKIRVHVKGDKDSAVSDASFDYHFNTGLEKDSPLQNETALKMVLDLASDLCHEATFLGVYSAKEKVPSHHLEVDLSNAHVSVVDYVPHEVETHHQLEL